MPRRLASADEPKDVAVMGNGAEGDLEQELGPQQSLPNPEPQEAQPVLAAGPDLHVDTPEVSKGGADGVGVNAIQWRSASAWEPEFI